MSKIIICPGCEGEGLVHCKELTDYHKGLYHHWTEVCKRCKGSGRLQEEITVTRVPYKPVKPDKKGS